MQQGGYRRVARFAGLVPALLVVGMLVGTSIIYGVGQSLGYLPFVGHEALSLDAYHTVLVGPSRVVREFWPSLGFSLWVSGAATLLAAVGALLLVLPRSPRATMSTGVVFHLNLAFPPLVWAIGLLLVLSQSGVVARLAAVAGLIEVPADFPVLVRDRYGLGIILAYLSKGVPFLALIVLAILRAQPEGYDLVAENLGANRWQRLRYVTLPLVLPGLVGGALLLFAFIFGAYEVPALLGVRFPRMLAVLALEFFLSPDLGNRAEGMAITVLMALIVLAVAGVARAIAAARGG